MTGCWRLSRPNTTEVRQFDTEVEAIIAAVREDPKAPRLIWQDWFDYPRYNVGRVA